VVLRTAPGSRVGTGDLSCDNSRQHFAFVGGRIAYLHPKARQRTVPTCSSSDEDLGTSKWRRRGSERAWAFCEARALPLLPSPCAPASVPPKELRCGLHLARTLLRTPSGLAMLNQRGEGAE
jgi:hypothetical protein